MAIAIKMAKNNGIIGNNENEKILEATPIKKRACKPNFTEIITTNAIIEHIINTKTVFSMGSVKTRRKYKFVRTSLNNLGVKLYNLGPAPSEMVSNGVERYNKEIIKPASKS